MTNARLLRPSATRALRAHSRTGVRPRGLTRPTHASHPQIGIFLRSFPLHRPPLCAGNDRRNLLDPAGCCARSSRSQAVRGNPRGLPVQHICCTPRYGDH
jgi:hypothetical protein